jgi:hypothetical protein
VPKFMLFLYDNQEDRAQWHKVSPEEMQKGVENYLRWAKKPFVVGSQRLGVDVGRVIRSKGGKPRVTDGPFIETKEVLGGYYVIEATNYDEAVKLALDHPHLEHGTIEIRQVYGT